MNKGPIDREYAIAQMDKAIAEAAPEEKIYFERFKDFLMVCPSTEDLKHRYAKATTMELALKKLILALEYEDTYLRVSAFDDLAEVCEIGESPFGHPLFLRLSDEVNAARAAGTTEKLFKQYEDEIQKGA